MVLVTIGDAGPFTFLFDSGGGSANTITPELVDRLKLKPQRIRDEVGAGDQAVTASEVHVDRYAIGDLKITDQSFEVLDLDAIKRTFRFPALDGIIGLNVLGRPIACVDFEKQVLIFKDGLPDCFSGPSETISYRIDNETPAIAGAVNGSPAEFYVDTGDRSAFTIFKKFAEKTKLADQFNGSPTVISGRGIGGVIPAKFATLAEIKLGTQTLAPRVLTRMPLTTGGIFAKSSLSGSLGNDLLRRFNLVFDYANRKITFFKNSHFNDPYVFVAPTLRSQ